MLGMERQVEDTSGPNFSALYDLRSRVKRKLHKPFKLCA